MKTTYATQPLTFRQMEVLRRSARHFLKCNLIILFFYWIGCNAAFGQGSLQLHGDTVFKMPNYPNYFGVDFEMDWSDTPCYIFDTVINPDSSITGLKYFYNGSWQYGPLDMPLRVGLRGFTNLCVNRYTHYLLAGQPAANGLALTAYRFLGSPSWDPLGGIIDTAAFDFYDSNNPIMRIKPYGIVDELNGIYVYYREAGGAYTRPRVKEFDNGTWTDISTAGLDTAVAYMQMVANSNGVLYMSYTKWTGTTSLHEVKRFNGTSWTSVGTLPTFGLFGAVNVAPDGTVYYCAVSSSESRVLRYTGSSWQYVASPPGVLGTSQPKSFQVAFDTSSVPYILSDNIKILKLDGTTWREYATLLMNNSLDTIPAKMAFDSDNNLYVGTTKINTATNKRLGVVYSVKPPLSVSVSTNLDTICLGNSATLTATSANANGPVTYTWVGQGVSCTSCNVLQVSPTQTTTYSVVASDGTNADTASITVVVRNIGPVQIVGNNNNNCYGRNSTYTAQTSSYTGSTFEWYLNNNLVGTWSTYTGILEHGDIFWVKMTVQQCGYTSIDTFNTYNIKADPASLKLSPSSTNCLPLGTTITLSGASVYDDITWIGGPSFTSPNVGTVVVPHDTSPAGWAYNRYGMFVDAAGNIYVADSDRNRVQKWAPGATSGVTVAGGNGDGSAANQLSNPTGVFVTPNGSVYVADFGNYRIQRWDVGATTGVTVAGGNGRGAAANQLTGVSDLWIDAAGNIYIPDESNFRVQRWAPGATSGVTVAGGNGQGSAPNQLYGPSYIHGYGDTLYILDDNYKVLRWIAGQPTGVTVAGGNGNGMASNQIGLRGLYVDAQRNVYVGDAYGVVRKWAPGATEGVIATADGGTSTSQYIHPDAIFGIEMYNGDLYVLKGKQPIVQKWPQLAVGHTFTPTQNGYYYAIATTPWGCTRQSDTLQIGAIQRTEYKTIGMGQSYMGYVYPGTYIDTFASPTGCDSIRTLYLSVSGAPTVSISVTSGSLTVCHSNNPATLRANTSNFSGPVTYSWSPSSSLSCDTCQITVANPTAPTTYQVIATSGTEVDTAWIHIHMPNYANIVNNVLQVVAPPMGCSGIPYTFSISNSLPLDSGAYFAWRKNGIAVGNGPTYTTANLTNGDVIYATIISSGCSVAGYSSDTVTISGLSAALNTTLSSNGKHCIGQALLTVSGAPSNATIQWYRNNTLVSTAILPSGSTSYAPTSQGQHYAIVTIPGGCADTTSTISVNDYVATTVNQYLLVGQSYHGYTVSGTYVDTFSLTGTCDSIRTLHLYVNSSTFITTANDTVCSNTAIGLKAHPVGLSSPITYNWSISRNGGNYAAYNCNCDSITHGSYYYDSVLSYRVIASDGVNTDTAYQTIYVYQAAVDIVPITPLHCGATSVTFAAVPSASTWGPSQPTYTWWKNATHIGVGDTITYTGLVYGDNISVNINVGCPSNGFTTDTMRFYPNASHGPISLSNQGSGCAHQLELSSVSPLADIDWLLNGTSIATTPASSQATTVAGGNGYGNASNQLQLMSEYSQIHVDGNGNVYVPEAYGYRVSKWAPLATSGTTIPNNVAGGNSVPSGITMDNAGNLYTSDASRHFIVKWTPGATNGTVIAGTGVAGNTASQFKNPRTLHFDAAGNLYVLDYLNFRIQRWAPGATSGTTVASLSNGTNGNNINDFALVNNTLYLLRDSANVQFVVKWPIGATSGTVVAGTLQAYTAPNYIGGWYSLAVDAQENLYMGAHKFVYKLAAGATVPVVVVGDSMVSSIYYIEGIASLFVDANGDIYATYISRSSVIKWAQNSSNHTYTPTQSGTYTAKVTMPWGCETVSNPITISTTNVVDTVYQTINNGQSYYGYTNTGTYLDTFAIGTGCDSIRVLHLTVNPVNSLVWPGDANSDGVANMNDALYIGLGYNVVGPVRPNATNNWIGQPCPNWITTFGIGINHHHGDCNGNGQIDANDTVPILQNYGLTHLKQEQLAQAGNPLLYYSPVVRNIAPNTRVYIPVALGMAPDTAENIYGIAFSLNYDESLVVPGSAYFQAVNSWLGNVNTDLFYIQKPLSGGVVDAAIVRNDLTNRSGMGTIGMLSFITIDNISGKDLIEMALNLGFSNITMIDNAGKILPVGAQSDSLVISQEVGIANANRNENQLLVYPNPSQGQFSYLLQGATHMVHISLLDVTGRKVMEQVDVKAYGTIDVSTFAKGIYFFHITSAEGQEVRKIIVE